MKQLRWGLISTARINRALFIPLRTSPRNVLSGVASRDLAKAQAYAKEHNIPRAFGSYEEMLADPDIDVIYNPLPNNMHTEWTIKAAQAGKHILCEKPIANTVEEVDAMADAAKKAGVVLMEAFMYRHHPQTLRVKDMINNGAVGKLQIVRGSFMFKIGNEEDVRLNESLGGGSIWDVGCYPISYTRLIVGEEPVEVFGYGMFGSASKVDEIFAGQMRFANGVFAHFDCGFRSPVRVRMEIIGDKGNLTVLSPFTPRLNEKIILYNGEKEETFVTPGEDLYLGEVENMADAILNGAPIRMSLADSRNNVLTIQKFLESAKTGKPIAM